jgi:hypothetical protein
MMVEGPQWLSNSKDKAALLALGLYLLLNVSTFLRIANSLPKADRNSAQSQRLTSSSFTRLAHTF